VTRGLTVGGPAIRGRRGMCALAHAGSYIHPITMLAAKRVELGSTKSPRSSVNAIEWAKGGWRTQNTRRYVLRAHRLASPQRRGKRGRNQADSKNKIDPFSATVGFSFHSTCSTVHLFRPVRISPSFSSSLSLLFSSSQPSNLTPLDVWERKDSLEEHPIPLASHPIHPKDF
jgi:hypothetical protein